MRRLVFVLVCCNKLSKASAQIIDIKVPLVKPDKLIMSPNSIYNRWIKIAKNIYNEAEQCTLVNILYAHCLLQSNFKFHMNYKINK